MAYAAPSSVYIAAGDGLGDEIYANEDVRAAAAAFRAEVKRVWDRDVVEGGERAEFCFLVDVCIAVAKVVAKADAKGQANAEAKGQADAEAKGQADAEAKVTTTSSEMVRHLRAVNVSYQKFVDAQKSEQKNEQHGHGGVAATCCEGGADGGVTDEFRLKTHEMKRNDAYSALWRAAQRGQVAAVETFMSPSMLPPHPNDLVLALAAAAKVAARNDHAGVLLLLWHGKVAECKVADCKAADCKAADCKVAECTRRQLLLGLAPWRACLEETACRSGRTAVCRNNDDDSVPHNRDGRNDGHPSDGLVHTMKQTRVTDEYSRGDMECPNCERRGPHRYTGHRYCVKCRFCTFCSLVNPTCKPLTEEEELNAWDDEDFIPDEDLTPAQLLARKAKEEEVLKRQAQAEYCAQHMTDGKNALHDFYEWQRRMM
jgi:hypothetical protein